jgi:hypothetical protein
LNEYVQKYCPVNEVCWSTVNAAHIQYKQLPPRAQIRAVQGYVGDTAEWEEEFAGVGSPTPIPADFHSCEITGFEGFSLYKNEPLLTGYVDAK